MKLFLGHQSQVGEFHISVLSAYIFCIPECTAYPILQQGSERMRSVCMFSAF
jgi:hypothetical protein